MRRKEIAILSVLAMLLFTASAALAVAAKFHSADGSVANNGALVVSFDERGLGNGNIDYTLDAHATAVFACINGGGKHPQAANKETFTAAGDFPVQSGYAEGTLSVTAEFDPSSPCPDPMTVVYSSITLTDQTSGISIKL